MYIILKKNDKEDFKNKNFRDFLEIPFSGWSIKDSEIKEEISSYDVERTYNRYNKKAFIFKLIEITEEEIEKLKKFDLEKEKKEEIATYNKIKEKYKL